MKMSEKLNVGDKVRLVKLPLRYKYLDLGGKRFYSRLLREKRALKVDEIDEHGTWVMFRMRYRKHTKLDIHFVNVGGRGDEECWRKVKPRSSHGRPGP
jgi:hypothetical protein